MSLSFFPEWSGLKGRLLLDHHLARYTSWRVGGVADCYYAPYNLADLCHFLKQVPSDWPVYFLGLGSNLLIADEGVRGVVIHTLKALNKIEVSDIAWVRAEAGVTCAKLSKYAAKHGSLEGVFFAGIPGTVGGALAERGCFWWRDMAACGCCGNS